jgi:hypothetical protein
MYPAGVKTTSTMSRSVNSDRDRIVNLVHAFGSGVQTNALFIQQDTFVVKPLGENELDAVLEVYRQCENFLALGPQPRASMKMVLDDIEHSRAENGVFCGIYNPEGTMMGILDVVPRNFEGNARHAFISLLMIAARMVKKTHPRGNGATLRGSSRE